MQINPVFTGWYHPIGDFTFDLLNYKNTHHEKVIIGCNSAGFYH